MPMQYRRTNDVEDYHDADAFGRNPGTPRLDARRSANVTDHDALPAGLFISPSSRCARWLRRPGPAPATSVGDARSRPRVADAPAIDQRDWSRNRLSPKRSTSSSASPHPAATSAACSTRRTSGATSPSATGRRRPRPADCESTTGRASRCRAGEQPAFICAGDTVLGGGEPLAYGKSLSAGHAGLRQRRIGNHVPRHRDRPWLLDRPRGVPAVLNVGARARGQRDLCGRARLDYCRPSQRATISPVARGCSAVGSAQPCQGWGRGFESRHPLEGADGINPSGGVAEW